MMGCTAWNRQLPQWMDWWMSRSTRPVVSPEACHLSSPYEHAERRPWKLASRSSTNSWSGARTRQGLQRQLKCFFMIWGKHTFCENFRDWNICQVFRHLMARKGSFLEPEARHFKHMRFEGPGSCPFPFQLRFSRMTLLDMSMPLRWPLRMWPSWHEKTHSMWLMRCLAVLEVAREQFFRAGWKEKAWLQYSLEQSLRAWLQRSFLRQARRERLGQQQWQSEAPGSIARMVTNNCFLGDSLIIMIMQGERRNKLYIIGFATYVEWFFASARVWTPEASAPFVKECMIKPPAMGLITNYTENRGSLSTKIWVWAGALVVGTRTGAHPGTTGKLEPARIADTHVTFQLLRPTLDPARQTLKTHQPTNNQQTRKPTKT